MINHLNEIEMLFGLNIKKDIYLDTYTILNRIELKMWTICAFRVLNSPLWLAVGPQSI